LPLRFRRESAAGLEATYHFTFLAHGEQRFTVVSCDRTLSTSLAHIGTADLVVTADDDVWLGFLAGEKNLPWALLRRKIRLKGSPRLLLRFGRCFPA
jgi:putative sterol carrier protein